jgi:hypothetical protein
MQRILLLAAAAATAFELRPEVRVRAAKLLKAVAVQQDSTSVGESLALSFDENFSYFDAVENFSVQSYAALGPNYAASIQAELSQMEELSDEEACMIDATSKESTNDAVRERESKKQRTGKDATGGLQLAVTPKPPQDADGNYPCAHKCGRVFGHAPAAVAHSKACKMKPDGWQPIPTNPTRAVGTHSNPLNCLWLKNKTQFDAFADEVENKIKINGEKGSEVLIKGVNNILGCATEKHPGLLRYTNVFTNFSRGAAWSRHNIQRLCKCSLERVYYLENNEGCDPHKCDDVYKTVVDELRKLGCVETNFTTIGDIKGPFEKLVSPTNRWQGGYANSNHFILQCTMLLQKGMVYSIMNGRLDPFIAGRGACTYARHTLDKPTLDDLDRWADGYFIKRADNADETLCEAIRFPREAKLRTSKLFENRLPDDAVILVCPTYPAWQKHALKKGMYVGDVIKAGGLDPDDMSLAGVASVNRLAEGGIEGALARFAKKNPVAAELFPIMDAFGTIRLTSRSAKKYEFHQLNTVLTAINGLRSGHTDLLKSVEIVVISGGLVYGNEHSLDNLKEWDPSWALSKKVLELLKGQEGPKKIQSFADLEMAPLTQKGVIACDPGSDNNNKGRRWVPENQAVADANSPTGYYIKTKADGREFKEMRCPNGHEFDYGAHNQGECKGTFKPREKAECTRRGIRCPTCGAYGPKYIGTEPWFYTEDAEGGWCLCGRDESYGEMFQCDAEGGCGNWFHPACLGLAGPPDEDYLCKKCIAAAAAAESSDDADY